MTTNTFRPGQPGQRRPALERDRTSTLVRAFDEICRAPVARGDLGWTLGASPSTVTAAVQNLRRRGLIRETRAIESTGGRPPRMLDLADDIGGVLVADVGGVNLRVASADLRGRIATRRAAATPRSSEALRRGLREALELAADDFPGPIRQIAIGVSGVVDPDTQAVSITSNVPGWPAEHPREWLSDLDAPVALENEANLSALGEYVSGSAMGVGSMLFVTLGAGVGAGVLLGGEIFAGATGAAGEIGGLRTSALSASPTLEQEAAAEGLARRYRLYGGDPRIATAREVFVRAAEPAARRAIAETLELLAVGIANAVCILDPQVVVLGGGLAQAGDAMLLPIRRLLEGMLPDPPPVLLSRLGPEASLTGAACLAASEARRRISAALDAAPRPVRPTRSIDR